MKRKATNLFSMSLWKNLVFMWNMEPLQHLKVK